MPYCTAADVRLVIVTALTDAEISEVIEMSDAEIDYILGAQDPTNKLIKKLSVLLSAHMIKTRQPSSQAIGQYREDTGNVLEVWEREIMWIYGLHRPFSVKASEYRHIEESERYPEG